MVPYDDVDVADLDDGFDTLMTRLSMMSKGDLDD